jgi:beta-ribofuranosylaminobenzene 5'-phosphate synthase
MRTVRVAAPARLHMGMLDASGEGPRRFGGIGVAVTRPAAVVEASEAESLEVEGPDAERARAVAERLGGGARIRVLEAIPPHAGLGSGTKLALAVAEAVCQLRGESPSVEDLARIAGRGARSAVGLWTFAAGGFVVEGGRRHGSDEPAPLLVHHHMPLDWRCILAIPAADPGLSGSAEVAAFAELRPDPARSARIAQIVMTGLLPALVESDVAEFGAALTDLQRLVGDSFAPVQGGTFHPQAAPLVEALLRLGAAGAGQSSWGPAVYGIAGHREHAEAIADALRGELPAGGTVEVVEFDNAGAVIETLL